MVRYDPLEISYALMYLRPCARWMAVNGIVEWKDDIQIQPSETEIDEIIIAIRNNKEKAYSNQYTWDKVNKTWVLNKAALSREVDKNRMQLLTYADGIIQRHQSEERLVKAGKLTKTTLTDEQILAWDEYKQKLRDITNGITPEDIPNLVYPAMPQ